MRSIESIPITDESKRIISFEISKQLATNNIEISIVSFSDSRLIVRIHQKESKNEKQIDKKSLEAIAKNIFLNHIPSDWKLSISAVDFCRKDIANIDATWILKRMEEYRLKPKHLSTYTGIDKADFDNLLKGKTALSLWQQVAFYYFFKYRNASDFFIK